LIGRALQATFGIGTVLPYDCCTFILGPFNSEVQREDLLANFTASFDGHLVTCGCGELDMLVPGYTVTIHKSQGSEYPSVVIPVMTQRYAIAATELALHRHHRGRSLSCW
jgi:UvrD-like helicase C-terminal domain